MKGNLNRFWALAKKGASQTLTEKESNEITELYAELCEEFSAGTKERKAIDALHALVEREG